MLLITNFGLINAQKEFKMKFSKTGLEQPDLTIYTIGFPLVIRCITFTNPKTIPAIPTMPTTIASASDPEHEIWQASAATPYPRTRAAKTARAI